MKDKVFSIVFFSAIFIIIIVDIIISMIYSVRIIRNCEKAEQYKKIANWLIGVSIVTILVLFLTQFRLPGALCILMTVNILLSIELVENAEVECSMMKTFSKIVYAVDILFVFIALIIIFAALFSSTTQRNFMSKRFSPFGFHQFFLRTKKPTKFHVLDYIIML